MINKHQVLKDWVQEFLGTQSLNFETIERTMGARTFVPVYGDNTINTNVLGHKTKEYVFAFVGIEMLDVGNGSDINIENMQMFDTFNDWIVKKEESKEYPNFGEGTSILGVEPLQNMANATQYDESTQTMKYILQCRIIYKEE